MKNHMRDFASFKEKIRPTYEYQRIMRIAVVKDLEIKMQELSTPYNTLAKIKADAEKIKQRLF
jgi:hypothetical protein